MRNAQTILGIIHTRGEQGKPLERVYRLLFCRDLYLLAYGKIYRNKGAMTKGTTPETVDEMSLAKIDRIIADLRFERYRFKPTRRVYLKKKNSTKLRPLSMPGWSDKLLQEVIRLILESYFEPQFSDCSHGFRPNRGCHTALEEIGHNWLGTSWFIEGDIQACFDTIDKTILLEILAEHIHDGRFIGLIGGLIDAGYLEDWKYHSTLSGVPQGGLVSPILANIYLTKLDRYVEQTLIPQFTKGLKRKPNLQYKRLLYQQSQLRKAGKKAQAKQVRRQMQKLPTQDVFDPDYRRLRYVRYADDVLFGFVGTREEAVEIKQKLKEFLQTELRLELSEEKTLITHARTQEARFLGYAISTSQADTYRLKTPKRNLRSVNGKIELKIPRSVIGEKCRRYMRGGKPARRQEMTHDSVFSIISQYQAVYRGIVGYYRLANNLHQLNQLNRVMEQSLVKTLACKLKLTMSKIYRKFQTVFLVEGQPYKGLQVSVSREKQEKSSLVTHWGGIPLKHQNWAKLKDRVVPQWSGHSEVVQRLLAQKCELCGSEENICVHHVRALKDLNKPGRRKKPEWMEKMAARQRKTLVVCRKCHSAIHHGHPLPGEPALSKLADKSSSNLKENRV